MNILVNRYIHIVVIGFYDFEILMSIRKTRGNRKEMKIR